VSIGYGAVLQQQQQQRLGARKSVADCTSNLCPNALLLFKLTAVSGLSKKHRGRYPFFFGSNLRHGGLVGLQVLFFDLRGRGGGLAMDVDPLEGAAFPDGRRPLLRPEPVDLL